MTRNHSNQTATADSFKPAVLLTTVFSDVAAHDWPVRECKLWSPQLWMCLTPHPLLQPSSCKECSHFQLWQGDKKDFLRPPDWHQRPGRLRQAARAPGPRLRLRYDKAKDGCQKKQECEQQPPLPGNRGDTWEIHLWLHAHKSVICMYSVRSPMRTCMCLCLCVSAHVCRADQMLRSSLQGALISCVFTVTDGQQSEAGPAAGPGRDEWHSLQRTTAPRQPAITPTRPLQTYTQWAVWPASFNAKSIRKQTHFPLW